MAKAHLRGRQIFKFGLLRKKDNKKNLKIRLVFNRMVVAFFPPYYSYTNPLCSIMSNLELRKSPKMSNLYNQKHTGFTIKNKEKMRNFIHYLTPSIVSKTLSSCLLCSLR